MMAVPERPAREEVVWTPMSVYVAVWAIIVDARAVNARRIYVLPRLDVHSTLSVDGRGLVVVTLDDALSLHDARRRRSLDDALTVGVIGPEIGARGWSREEKEGQRKES
jgi:hypothetical protein